MHKLKKYILIFWLCVKNTINDADYLHKYRTFKLLNISIIIYNYNKYISFDN